MKTLATEASSVALATLLLCASTVMPLLLPFSTPNCKQIKKSPIKTFFPYYSYTFMSHFLLVLNKRNTCILTENLGEDKPFSLGVRVSFYGFYFIRVVHGL